MMPSKQVMVFYKYFYLIWSICHIFDNKGFNWNNFEVNDKFEVIFDTFFMVISIHYLHSMYIMFHPSIAIRFGILSLLNYQIKTKDDLQQGNNKGYTPIHIACKLSNFY